jgi:hypothetical protein
VVLARASEHVHGEVGGDLVVAGARGVQLAPHGPREFDQAPLDRHVDVFVAVLEGEHPERELRLDLFESLDQVVALLHRDDPPLGQHPGVRAGLLDVLGPQPPVEAQRGVQAPEVGVLGLTKA